MTSTSLYVCGVDAVSLEKIIGKLAPTCEQCHYPMTVMCVEASCTGDALFCEECDQVKHLSHRSNALSVLFHHRSLVVDNAQYEKASIEKIIKNIKQSLKDKI